MLGLYFRFQRLKSLRQFNLRYFWNYPMSICSRIKSLYVPAKNPGSNSRLIAAFILFFARQVITSSGFTSNLMNGRPLTSAELSSISAI